MKRTQWMSGLSSALLIVAVGCGSHAQSNAPTTPADVAQAQSQGNVAQVGAGEEVDESTADLASHHRHHSHGGFAMFIAMSLDSIGASPEQEVQIKKIQADLHAKMQPAHDAEKKVILELADEVAAGNVDIKKLDPAIGQMSAAAAGMHDAVADSLNELHNVLTAEQRQALVDKVEAQFEVWNHTNASEETADRDAHGGQLGEMVKEYGLTPDQVEKIRANFKAATGGTKAFDRAEADEHLKEFGAAFASDKFDAKSMKTGATLNEHIATWGVTRMALIYQAAAPVLTAEQRTKMADTLRRHANYKRTENEN